MCTAQRGVRRIVKQGFVGRRHSPSNTTLTASLRRGRGRRGRQHPSRATREALAILVAQPERREPHSCRAFAAWAMLGSNTHPEVISGVRGRFRCSEVIYGALRFAQFVPTLFRRWCKRAVPCSTKTVICPARVEAWTWSPAARVRRPSPLKNGRYWARNRTRGFSQVLSPMPPALRCSRIRSGWYPRWYLSVDGRGVGRLRGPRASRHPSPCSFRQSADLHHRADLAPRPRPRLRGDSRGQTRRLQGPLHDE
jgi:hypothetical protein